MASLGRSGARVWVALGCSGAALECSGAALGCSGPAGLECFGAALGCSGLLWSVLGLLWAALGLLWSRAAKTKSDSLVCTTEMTWKSL